MNGSGDQLFSGAGFTLNQDGCIRLRNTSGCIQNGNQRTRSANDVLEAGPLVEGAPKQANFVNQPVALKYPSYQSSQFSGMDWLGDVIIGTGFDRRHGCLNRAVSCNNYYTDVRIL